MTKVNTNSSMKNYHLENLSEIMADIETLYALADMCAYLALRARHAKSGLNLMLQLINAAPIDKRTRALSRERIAADLAAAEHERDQINTDIAYAKSQSLRLTLTDSERDAWSHKVDALTRRRDALTSTINGLYDALAMTSSDREDIVQSAALAICECAINPAAIDRAALARHGYDSLSDVPSDAMSALQADANLHTICTAARRAIDALATPEITCNSITSLDKQPMTAAEVDAWIAAYGDVGADVKVYTPCKSARLTDCYTTVEYKQTKTLQGYYKIKHYKAAPNYQYFEDYTAETGRSVEYIKTYNPFVSSRADIDRLDALTNNPALKPRERDFIKKFMQLCRNYDYKQSLKMALRAVGVADNNYMFIKRLKHRLQTITQK